MLAFLNRTCANTSIHSTKASVKYSPDSSPENSLRDLSMHTHAGNYHMGVFAVHQWLAEWATSLVLCGLHQYLASEATLNLPVAL